MEWLLILFLITPVGIHSQSVTMYDQATCERAGQKAVNDLKNVYTRTVVYSCVNRNYK